MIIFGCKPGATKFRNCLGLFDTCPGGATALRMAQAGGQVSNKPKQYGQELTFASGRFLTLYSNGSRKRSEPGGAVSLR